MQGSLVPITITSLIDAKLAGFDGADLKVIAHCDDGNDYAVKRIQDGALVPLAEWVGHSLWHDCGLPTPDFAILGDLGGPPAFGSRLELHGRQVKKNDTSYAVSNYFAPHADTLSRCFPLDAWFANPDRHGRNFLERPSITGALLLCIDWSRAWVTSAEPWGDGAHEAASCNTAKWWTFLRTVRRLTADFAAVDRAVALPDDWMTRTLDAAPAEWKAPVDAQRIIDFWRTRRDDLRASARSWVSRF